MTASTTNQYSQAQAEKAATALKAYLASQKTTSSKQSLFDADDESDLEDGVVGVTDPDLALWLIVTTKKFISHNKKTKQERIVLPNPYLTSPSPTFTVCIITKDPSTYYRSLVSHLPYHPSSLTIISPSKLKTHYKTFETRRQLERSHDIFLADDRIITLLPNLLGKSVYGRSAKVPIPIKLSKIETPGKDSESVPKVKLQADAERLQKEIEKAVKGTYFIPSPSPTQTIKIGIWSQSSSSIAENITAVLSHLANNLVNGGWSGVRSVHLKAAETAALPIWLTETLYDKDDVLTEEEIKRIDHLKTDEGREERKKELKEKKEERKKGREEKKKAKRNWDSDAESGEEQWFVKKTKPKAIKDTETKKRKAEVEGEEPGSAKKAKVAEEVVDDDSEEEGGVKLPQSVDLSEQAKKLKIGDKRIAPPAPALKSEKKRKDTEKPRSNGKPGIKEKLKRKASKTDITATKGKKTKAYR
ncbi:hypothetical protein ABW19_dt0207675 [Dactylella cylindrospora]|nr:hypothetical protein ABW19_dt0207675 [Dactylella cylindrospora]